MIIDYPTLVYLVPGINCKNFYLFEGPYINYEKPHRWLLTKVEGLVKKQIEVPDYDVEHEGTTDLV